MADAEGFPWEATFVENVVRARKQMKLSQTELARRLAARGLPFHQQTVQRIEQGARPLRLNEAVILAGVLQMDDLIEALTPRTVDRRLQTLREATKTSRANLVTFDGVVDGFKLEAEEARAALQTERDAYVTTALALGHERPQDENAVLLADAVVEAWVRVEQALDLREVKRGEHQAES